MSSIPSLSYFAGRRLRLYSLTFACAGILIGTAIGKLQGFAQHVLLGIAATAYFYGLWAVFRLINAERQAHKERAATVPH